MSQTHTHFAFIFYLYLIAVVNSTSCATANLDPFQKFSGIHSSQNGIKHQWEIKFVELTDDLMYDVEIINGDKIELLMNGDPSIPPPMIFIHGWLDSRLSWMTIIPYILDTVSSNQIIILPTLRGHGDSQIFPVHSSTFDYTQYVDDIILLLQKLLFSSDKLIYNFVGHSMGGGIAMQTVINHPNIVNKVVFMDSSPAFQVSGLFEFDAKKDEPTFEQLKQMIKNFNFPQVEKGWITKQLCNIMDRENLKVNSMAARMSFDGLKVLNITDDLIDTVEKFNIESMVLYGEHDFVTMESQNDYGRNINAKMVTFRDCGHDPHYRYPEHVANVIVEFFFDNADKKDL